MRGNAMIGFLLLLNVFECHACNSTKQCDFPFNNPFTTNDTMHPSWTDCCWVMPRIPLIDTGAPGSFLVSTPPDMHHPGAVCPELPSDVVIAQGLNPWRNGSLYKRPKIFFVEGIETGDGPEGDYIPKTGVAGCAKPHHFYTQYINARAKGSSIEAGIPVLGSSIAPKAALLTAAETIAEMLRQIDGKVPGLRAAMVHHSQRFAVWADAERRFDTCEKCMKIDPTFDCNSHIDSRAGRDTSYHPEMPECQEGGGGSGITPPTSYTEEYGIPYLEPNGTIRDSYCGTNIVAHEFFHSIHDTGIQTVALPLYMKIEQAAARAVREGLYVHHPGARDDGCNDDFSRCVAYEFMVKAHMTWNGFPADRREFAYQSRAEMKEKAPWIAQLVFSLFEDGDWNPALGAVIDTPRDQTFGLVCSTAPGSALCGKPLAKVYTGPPMEDVLRRCSGDCTNAPTKT